MTTIKAMFNLGPWEIILILLVIITFQKKIY